MTNKVTFGTGCVEKRLTLARSTTPLDFLPLLLLAEYSHHHHHKGQPGLSAFMLWPWQRPSVAVVAVTALQLRDVPTKHDPGCVTLVFDPTQPRPVSGGPPLKPEPDWKPLGWQER